MQSQPASPQTAALKIVDVHNLTESISVVVVNRSDGAVVERLTLMRYAGHYRSSSTHTVAVKDSKNKFGIRSEYQLGFTSDSPFETRLAPELIEVPNEIDLRDKLEPVAE